MKQKQTKDMHFAPKQEKHFSILTKHLNLIFVFNHIKLANNILGLPMASDMFSQFFYVRSLANIPRGI